MESCTNLKLPVGIPKDLLNKVMKKSYQHYANSLVCLQEETRQCQSHGVSNYILPAWMKLCPDDKRPSGKQLASDEMLLETKR